MAWKFQQRVIGKQVFNLFFQNCVSWTKQDFDYIKGSSTLYKFLIPNSELGEKNWIKWAQMTVLETTYHGGLSWRSIMTIYRDDLSWRSIVTIYHEDLSDDLSWTGQNNFSTTPYSSIYSQQKESSWAVITVGTGIVLITNINTGRSLQWSGCVSWISTAEGFALKKIFFHEYRNLTWILTKLTSFYHHSYPTSGIATSKWAFIAVFFKHSLKSTLDVD